MNELPGSNHAQGGRNAEAWHARTSADVLQTLDSGADGLATNEAKARLHRYGLNRLDQPDGPGKLRRFLGQFHNVLIYVLLGAAAVTAMLEQWLDTSVIIGVVVINALVGFLQEGKAERALDAIRAMLSPSAQVIRDGRRHTVPAETLVPGDIVSVESGDRVPADLRLIDTWSLQVQEAALTGESVPVEKIVQPVPDTADLAERTSMAFSGTLVTNGQGRGVVVGTGEHTEIGRIGRLLARVTTLETPLLRNTAVFARWLTFAIGLLAITTFLFGYFVQGTSAQALFLATVGLVVAAIPEGLPAIMTITLAIGVTRMARHKAIIRLLPAVETLGAVSVICSDKTGTLTRNEMSVQTVMTASYAYQATGAGYAPTGEIRLDGERIALDHHSELRDAIIAAIRCCDAELSGGEDQWLVHGDPMEGALLALAAKAGCDLELERQADHRVDLVPFEAEHKYMATLHRDHAGVGHIYVKGAPERVLEMCVCQRVDGRDEPLVTERWRTAVDLLAGAGARVLAVASGNADAGHSRLSRADVEHGLTLLGLFGFMDPPREEAIAAVTRCQAAGIQVKMITGDHATTAGAIAARLGIGGDGKSVITGRMLDQFDDAEFTAIGAESDVFARTTPEHKLRLVEALQAQGHTVAMTGDGVNDAPALKRADVGIAMGRKGTEAAKEAAEMVLADDNFASIADAVEEGRSVYDNLRKTFLFILPTNGGEALVIMVAIVLGVTLPITAVQILWVNMITAVTLGLALAFEPAESDVMTRPPRSPDEPLLPGYLIWRIGFVSVLLMLGASALFVINLEPVGLEAARTIAVNTMVAGEIAYLLNSRRIHAAVGLRSGLLGGRAVPTAITVVIGAQLLFTYLPPMQELFGSAPIRLSAWAMIITFAIGLFLLVELEKALMRRIRGQPPTAAECIES